MGCATVNARSLPLQVLVLHIFVVLTLAVSSVSGSELPPTWFNVPSTRWNEQRTSDGLNFLPTIWSGTVIVTEQVLVYDRSLIVMPGTIVIFASPSAQILIQGGYAATQHFEIRGGNSTSSGRITFSGANVARSCISITSTANSADGTSTGAMVVTSAYFSGIDFRDFLGSPVQIDYNLVPTALLSQVRVVLEDCRFFRTRSQSSAYGINGPLVGSSGGYGSDGDCMWPAQFFAASFVRCEFAHSDFPQINAPLNFTDCTFHGGRLGLVSVLASRFDRCHFYDLDVALSINDQGFTAHNQVTYNDELWYSRRFTCGRTRPTLVLNCLFSNVSTAIMVTSGFSGISAMAAILVVQDSFILGGGVGIDCLSCAGVTVSGGWMCGQSKALVQLRADFSNEPFTRDASLYAGRCLSPNGAYAYTPPDLNCRPPGIDCCWVSPVAGTNVLDGVWLGVDTSTAAGSNAALAAIVKSPLNGDSVSPFTLGASVSAAPAWPARMQALYSLATASLCRAPPPSGPAPSASASPSYAAYSDSGARYDGTQLAINAAAAAVSSGLPPARFTPSYPTIYFNLLQPYNTGSWGHYSWEPMSDITNASVLSGPFIYNFAPYSVTVDFGASLTVLPGAIITGQLVVLGTLIVLGRADAFVRLDLDLLTIGPKANITMFFASVGGSMVVQCCGASVRIEDSIFVAIGGAIRISGAVAPPGLVNFLRCKIDGHVGSAADPPEPVRGFVFSDCYFGDFQGCTIFLGNFSRLERSISKSQVVGTGVVTDSIILCNSDLANYICPSTISGSLSVSDSIIFGPVWGAASLDNLISCTFADATFGSRSSTIKGPIAHAQRLWLGSGSVLHATVGLDPDLTFSSDQLLARRPRLSPGTASAIARWGVPYIPAGGAAAWTKALWNACIDDPCDNMVTCNGHGICTGRYHLRQYPDPQSEFYYPYNDYDYVSGKFLNRCVCSSGWTGEHCDFVLEL